MDDKSVSIEEEEDVVKKLTISTHIFGFQVQPVLAAVVVIGN